VFFARFISILMLAAIVSGCAPSAAPPAVAMRGKAFLPEKGRTLAPFAHVAFCVRTPGECRQRTGDAVVAMTAKNRAMLDGVNSAINNAIIPREDPARAGTWQVDPPAGDCNDYAVSKRNELIQAGLSTHAVRLAIAMTPQGIGHTVVVVRTTEGDMVLDNRNYEIKRWDRTDLAWLKVESSADPQQWDRL
jgi:predicted transglutaminase-like cysteine proteinase